MSWSNKNLRNSVFLRCWVPGASTALAQTWDSLHAWTPSHHMKQQNRQVCPAVQSISRFFLWFWLLLCKCKNPHVMCIRTQYMLPQTYRQSVSFPCSCSRWMASCCRRSISMLHLIWHHVLVASNCPNGKKGSGCVRKRTCWCEFCLKCEYSKVH